MFASTSVRSKCLFIWWWTFKFFFLNLFTSFIYYFVIITVCEVYFTWDNYALYHYLESFLEKIQIFFAVYIQICFLCTLNIYFHHRFPLHHFLFLILKQIKINGFHKLLNTRYNPTVQSSAIKITSLTYKYWEHVERKVLKVWITQKMGKQSVH